MSSLGAYSYLANGMTGAGVQEMQTDLYNLGFSISVDGKFGPQTFQAVRNFQYSWNQKMGTNLAIDGVVGAQTAAAIKQARSLQDQEKWYEEDLQQAPGVVTGGGGAPPVIGTQIQQGIPTYADTGYTENGGNGGLGIASIMDTISNLDWKWIAVGAAAVVGIVWWTRR